MLGRHLRPPCIEDSYVRRAGSGEPFHVVESLLRGGGLTPATTGEHEIGDRVGKKRSQYAPPSVWGESGATFSDGALFATFDWQTLYQILLTGHRS